jgi:septal ring factor EnvC (AmiA/AmiB activator)
MNVDWFKTILYLGIFTIMGILIWEYVLTEDNNHKIDKLLLSIEKQSSKIDSINERNKILSQELKTYKFLLDSIDSEIVKTQLELKTLNKQTNEKLNNIEYYSVNELERFFTERYSDRLNSKD